MTALAFDYLNIITSRHQRRNPKAGSRTNDKQRRSLISRSIAQNLPAVYRH